MDLKRFQQDMLRGPLVPNVVAYTVPIILTSFLQLLFNAADLMVVGQFCGDIYVAAVGNTGAITNLIINLFVGLSIGGGICIAHAVGSRDQEAMHRTVHTVVPAALASGVVLTVVGVALSETFLRWMDTPEEVLPLSALYMRIYFGGITFNMVYNFCASMLRAVGDTKSPLIFLSLAGVVNVVLNILFITVFHMDVDGVALATTISQGISAVLVVWALMRRTDACRLQLRKMRFYRAQLLKIAKLGLPAGIQGSLFSISNVMIQSSVNSFGQAMMSGNAAAGNIEGFVYACLNAFHQTALNFTGQNVGAGQYDRVKKILRVCLLSVTVVGLTAGSAAYALGPWLLRIYIPESPVSVAYGMLRMSFICLPYFLLGLMDVTTGVLRGLGASLTPTLISVLGICGLRIAWIYSIFLLPGFHTPQCLYASYPVSWIVTFVLELAAYAVIIRRKTACPAVPAGAEQV